MSSRTLPLLDVNSKGERAATHGEPDPALGQGRPDLPQTLAHEAVVAEIAAG